MNEISEENSFVSTTLTEVTEGGHISVLSVTMSHCLTNEKNVFIYALFDIFPVFLLIKAFHLKIKMTFLVIYKVHTITVYKECNFLQFLKVLSIAVASKWNLWVSCCDVFYANKLHNSKCCDNFGLLENVIRCFSSSLLYLYLW